MRHKKHPPTCHDRCRLHGLLRRVHLGCKHVGVLLHECHPLHESPLQLISLQSELGHRDLQSPPRNKGPCSVGRLVRASQLPTQRGACAVCIVQLLFDVAAAVDLLVLGMVDR